MTARKLTRAQIHWLKQAIKLGGKIYPGFEGNSACRALVRKGYMEACREWWDTRYDVTDAGRQALAREEA